MDSFITLITVLALFIQAINGQTENCQEHIVQECSNYLLSTTFDFNGLIVPKENVEFTCSRIDEAKKCIDDYFDNCKTTKTKESYIQEGGLVLFDVCKMFREDYLPHLDCYSQFEAKYNACLAEIPNIVGNFLQLQAESNNATKEQTTTFCCGVDKVVHCVVYPTFQSCGGQAAQTMEQFLRRQLPAPVLKICDVIDCSDINKIPEMMPVKPTQTTGNYASSALTSIITLTLSLSLLLLL